MIDFYDRIVALADASKPPPVERPKCCRVLHMVGGDEKIACECCATHLRAVAAHEERTELWREIARFFALMGFPTPPPPVVVSDHDKST